MLRHYEPWDFVGVSLVCSDPDLIKESQSCSAKNMDPSHAIAQPYGSISFRENHQRLGWRYPQEVTRFITGHRGGRKTVEEGQWGNTCCCCCCCCLFFF